MQDALRKGLLIAPFVERFKITTLGKSTDKFCQYLEQNFSALHFCQYFGDRRLSTRRSSKGAAHYSLFVEHFETDTLRKPHRKVLLVVKRKFISISFLSIFH